jgi:hypothetical protein
MIQAWNEVRSTVSYSPGRGALVNRTANAEGYMLPLGGPEFWLQAELQDAMDRLIKGHFRDVLAMPRAPYPRLEMSSRMTSSAGRCYPDSGSIKLATLYHRDHGIDATLLVLKHELAHWARAGVMVGASPRTDASSARLHTNSTPGSPSPARRSHRRSARSAAAGT